MCLRFWIKQHTKEINICRKKEKTTPNGHGGWCGAAVDVGIGPELISNWALRLG